MHSALPRDFYARDAVQVARELLGARLIRKKGRTQKSGFITETEAYLGAADTASHAHKRRTQRTAMLYSQPGATYVYFVYGLHHMLNVIAGSPGSGCAVLIRGLVPIVHNRTRNKTPHRTLDGPAKLTSFLNIDMKLNGEDLTSCTNLWIEPGIPLPPRVIQRTPRRGIGYAAPSDRQARLRFTLTRAADALLFEYPRPITCSSGPVAVAEKNRASRRRCI